MEFKRRLILLALVTIWMCSGLLVHPVNRLTPNRDRVSFLVIGRPISPYDLIMKKKSYGLGSVILRIDGLKIFQRLVALSFLTWCIVYVYAAADTYTFFDVE